jgi:hypothetical protein
VSSTTTVLRSSPTSQRFLAFLFPSSSILTSRGGDTGSETNFTTSSCKKRIG